MLRNTEHKDAFWKIPFLNEKKNAPSFAKVVGCWQMTEDREDFPKHDFS
jgi:hypothetical protein